MWDGGWGIQGSVGRSSEAGALHSILFSRSLYYSQLSGVVRRARFYICGVNVSFAWYGSSKIKIIIWIALIT